MGDLDLSGVPEMSGIDRAFGGSGRAWRSVFDALAAATRGRKPGPGEDLASRLFFEGGKLPKRRPNVDDPTYQRVMSFAIATLGSFEPDHNSKIRVVGALLEAVAEVPDVG